MFDLNVWSVLTMTQAFSPLLIAAKGTILNISSIVAKMGMPLMAAYNASKAAVDSLSQAMRYELTPFGVNTITVHTGIIKTKFFDNQVDLEISDTSEYAPIRDEVFKVFVPPADAADRHEFAKTVVSKALKSTKPADIWAGTASFPVWFLSSFVPTKLAESMMLRSTNLTVLSTAGTASKHN
jgi:1-acylglycerone phosphate reductase